jgi:CBS domain containing-hemolysin-like protein
MNTIAIILISLIFSAFFSGCEIAFISANKLRFELGKKEKNLTNSILNIFFNNNEQFISTMLVGNNITLVIYGIQMAILLKTPIETITTNSFLSSVIITIISTIIVIFTGDFIPKALFRINPNFVLKVFAVPLFLMYIALYPIVIFCTRLSIGILKLFKVKPNSNNKNRPLGKIDLSYIIEESIEKTPENEEIDPEVKLFQNALDFSDIRLKECIVPRTEIIGIPTEGTLDELKTKFIKSGKSKVIVYEENIDNVVGYIDSAEMFKNAENWKQHVKTMPIVPETMAANKLMKLFTQQKKNMAMVVDEFGGTAGIVTLEDVMEEIFGEIEDEHDSNKYISKKINENQYILSGRLEIDFVNEKFGLDLPIADQYVTIAGLILFYATKVPKYNEIIEVDKFLFQTIKVSKNKIELVKLTLLAK